MPQNGTFERTFLKITSLTKFFHYKNKKIMCNVKLTWMLKVFHVTINVNKEPLFLRVYMVISIMSLSTSDYIV